jgi:hypothetical protein
MFGQLEDGFVRQVTRGGQTRNVGNGRPAPLGDQNFLEAQPLPIDLDRVASDEAGVPEQHVMPAPAATATASKLLLKAHISRTRS